MKNFALLGLLLALVPGWRQNTAGSSAAPGSELDRVLDQMDRASATFKTAEADFEWDNYQKVVDETDKQKGRVYFHHSGAETEAMFDISSPDVKQVLFKAGKLTLYSPKIDQATEYEPGRSRGDVQGFLSLGFGANGHDLLKSYQVKLDGWESIDAVRTAKLELVALSPKVRSMFSQFFLWIDPERDVPVKQQLLEPSGDYWLAHYTGFRLGAKIPDEIFHIRTTAKTKVVRPQ